MDKRREEAIIAYKEMTISALDKIFRGRQMLLNKEDDDTELRKELDTFIAEKSKDIVARLEKMPNVALELMALMDIVAIGDDIEDIIGMVEEENE